MNLSSHFQFIARGSRPPALPKDQFEFTVDRSARRIVPWFDPLAARERVRIQSNRVFEWRGRVQLPDISTGLVRPVTCTVRVDGVMPGDEAACRTVLGLALKFDLDFDKMMLAPIEQAINDQRVALRGAFVATLRDAVGRQHVQESIALAIRRAGFDVDTVSLTPLSYDPSQGVIDLEDSTGSLEIRSRGSLETHRIAYKARLGWGRLNEHFIGRVAYSGTIMGKTAGTPLANPLVPGQIQPVEAYFRALLAAALGNESWTSVHAGDAQTTERVRNDVSEKLGRGTGRVVDTLVVYPVTTNTPDAAERSVRFRESYSVTGIQARSLVIEHSVIFGLVDRDRWIAQQSPDPESYIKSQIAEATRIFLADKRFEDVVDLYLSDDGEARVHTGIDARVARFANVIGYRIISNAALLAIPEIDFIHGRDLPFPEEEYSLADPHLAPRIRIRVAVRVLSDRENLKRFARAMSTQDEFEERVRIVINDEVRRTLRGFGAYDYYASPYVNSVPHPADASPDLAGGPVLDDDPLRRTLMSAVNFALEGRFGLQLLSFDLQPGNDPLIDKMKYLTRVPIRRDIRILFDRGVGMQQATLYAMATIFVVSIDQQNWSSFHHSAERYGSFEQHADEIVEMLRETLRLLEPLVVTGNLDGLKYGDWQHQIVDRFGKRIREEFGLVARLSVALRVHRPGIGDTAAMELGYLRADLEQNYKLLDTNAMEEHSTFGDEDERRERVMKRIKKIKEQISELAEKQELATQMTEVVQIQQDRLTGTLIAQGPES